MNQRNIITGLVILVLLGLGGWYLYSSIQGGAWSMSGTATTTQEIATTTAASSGSTATSKPRTLNDVVAQGGNYTCTLETITSDQHTTGTVYGAGGKTRLDLTVAFNTGNTVVTHIIRSGTTSYTWVDGQQTGTKATITATTPIVDQPNGGTASLDSATNFSSDCHPWVPDATKFTPPTLISFVAR